jgi:hypothetical protein
VGHVIGDFGIWWFILVIVDVSEHLSLDSLQQKFTENFTGSDVQRSEAVDAQTTSDDTQDVVRVNNDDGGHNVDIETVNQDHEAQNFQNEKCDTVTEFSEEMAAMDDLTETGVVSLVFHL